MIGYILCLHDPQIEFLQLQCTFNMFKTPAVHRIDSEDIWFISSLRVRTTRSFKHIECALELQKLNLWVMKTQNIAYHRYVEILIMLKYC